MDEDRYYNLGSHDKLFNQIDELTDALASRDAEIESLRQQLNANNPLLDEAADELDRNKEEIESLRQQLAAAQETLKDHGEIQAVLCKQLFAALAACKVKDEAIVSQMKVTSWEEQAQANDLSEDAIAIQPDGSALKAWLGEPVAHMYQHDETGRVTFVAMPDRMSERRWHEIPLYAPKGMK